MRALFVCLIACLWGFATVRSVAALSYVESSTGLVPPTMEGGRTEVEMGDVDNDGNIDLVSIGDHGSPYVNTDEHGIMVWFGDGTGSWSVFQYGDFGYGGVALGDVNNDGFMDVGYGMHHDYSGVDLGDQLLEVALGDGSGKMWTAWDDGLATNGEDWGMFSTDFGDVDNDGDLDVGSVSFGCCAGLHVYINNGDGTWTQSFGFTGGNCQMDAKFGDVNGDGNADIGVAQQYGTVYLGDGAGGFVLGDGDLPSPGNMGLAGVDLGDANNDGKDELSFINSSGGVEVWAWQDTGNWVSMSGTLPASGSFEFSQLCDMDADGYLDVVAFGSMTLRIWTGDGAGGWTQDTSFTTHSPGYGEAFRVGGDVDHNGYPDIALVEDEGSWPSDYNHLRFYRESSTPDSLYIRPVYPRGGEKFYGGSVKFIKWITAVPVSAATVRLELSTQGPSGPWIPIADSLKDNGRHQWSVMNYVNSNNCYVRYTAFSAGESATCMTPAAFEIISPTVVLERHVEPPTKRFRLDVLPNPAQRSVNISFTIPGREKASLNAYDLTGRLVRTIIAEQTVSGTCGTIWNGRGDDGKEVRPGTYFLRLDAGTSHVTRKAVLMGD